jgi:CDGSH-type Zn-finger protein
MSDSARDVDRNGERDDRVRISPYPDGPLIVRGDVVITGPDGEDIVPARRTVALCRCGISSIKPFCDGTHKLIDFRTDPAPAS